MTAGYVGADDPGRLVAAQVSSSSKFTLTTHNSVYDLLLDAHGDGTITRLGGSSPYVPPEIADRPEQDGIAMPVGNGRFELHNGLVSFWWGLGCHTSWIDKMQNERGQSLDPEAFVVTNRQNRGEAI